MDVFWPISLLRGVEGGRDGAGEDVVVGVGKLETDDWDEWPRRDRDLLPPRCRIGPPLSETGSSEDCV